ncbi:MAG: metal-dependent transcriptional regulator [Chloroflexota bacterium]
MNDDECRPTAEIIEEYLEALYNLEQRERPVRPATLAQHLNLTLSAMTEVLERMQSQGVINRLPDQGIELTEAGRRLASKMVRRHRLAERLLVDILGLPWHRSHDEACRLEHALSAETEDALARLLKGVETCPHGNPIPDAEGNIPEDDTSPLVDLKPQQSGYIVNIEDENHEELHYLASLGLVPGAQVTVAERAPFSGPLLVCVGRARYALGRSIASKIKVAREREPGHHHRHRRGRGHRGA